MRRDVLFISFFVIGCWNSVIAQDSPPGGEIEDAQIIIEKDKELTLPKANRIYKRTNVRSITTETQELEYQITQPTYHFQQYVPGFRFESFAAKGRSSAEGYDNFIKAGYGNYNSPLLQGYMGYKSDDSQAGLWVNHESFGKGPIRDKESAFGFTEVLLNGNWQGYDLEVNPDVYYQREGYFPYGYDPESITDVDFDYQDRKVGASVLRAGVPVSFTPSDEWRIKLSPEYQLTTMKFQDEDPFNQEHLFRIMGDVSFAFDEDFVIGVNSAFTSLEYTGPDQSRGIFKANPYMDFKGEDFNFRGGLRFFKANSSPDSVSGNYLYLDAAASYQLSSGFGLFAEFRGDLEPVTLNNLRIQNRYLEDSLVFLNQEIPVHFKGGLELGFSEKLLFRPYIRYKLTKNKAVFVHSEQDSSRFAVRYDAGNFNEFSIGVEGQYIAAKSTSLSLMAAYTAYNPGELEEAWYLPSFDMDLTGSQKFGDKFTMDISIFVLAGIKAPAPLVDDVVKLDPIADLGIGGQYAFTDHIGSFLEFDNLLSRNYERYLNYPVRGFMAKGGFIYRF